MSKTIKEVAFKLKDALQNSAVIPCETAYRGWGIGDDTEIQVFDIRNLGYPVDWVGFDADILCGELIEFFSDAQPKAAPEKSEGK